MKTLLIDNHDSMTFNLLQCLGEVNGEAPVVLRNDEASWAEIEAMRPAAIVISPGPGRPQRARDFGVSAEVIRNARVPVLGVCLGHQGIGHAHGARVCHAPEPVHGRASPIHHRGRGLFAGLPSPFLGVRYHSLILAAPLPSGLECQAWTGGGEVMALAVRGRPMWGLQFHPESVCTEHGRRILANFRDLATAAGARPPMPPRPPGPAAGAGRPAVEYRLHHRRLALWADPERVFAGLFGGARHAFWLDSSLSGPGVARFSYMGDAGGPHAEVLRYRAAGRRLEIERAGGTAVLREGIFDHLKRELGRRRVRGEAALPFAFNGGFAGFLGYELKQECGAAAGHSSATPDAAFVFADRLLVADHEQRTLWLVGLAREGESAAVAAWMDGMVAALEALPALPPPEPGRRGAPVRFRQRHDRGDYEARIRACLREIRDGESYEVCLTNRIGTRERLDPLLLHRVLRRSNPAPYAAFLRLPGATVCCSSPERFLKITPDGRMEARPIKGTIRRGAGPDEDALLARRLQASEKDRAENLMIVDLLRNDLGSVAELGSVSVPRLMAIESYATVHQMVSMVSGRLRAGLHPVDAVRAAFPPGSMTGAPKRRTLEILDALEDGPRGVYSGAIGFFALGGAVDLNVVIRTVVDDGRELAIGSGGAITHLSDPRAEIEEMLLKAAAPMRAIARVVTGRDDGFVIDDLGGDGMPEAAAAPNRPSGCAPFDHEGLRIRERQA